MLNTKMFKRQYQKFTPHERSVLMMNATIRKDNQEFDKLKRSADTKSFSITASEEGDFYDAWMSSHEKYIMLKQSFSINYLAFAYGKLRGAVIDDQIVTYLSDMVALDVAFDDYLKKHNLPKHIDFISAFNTLDSSIIFDNNNDVEDIARETDEYKKYFEMFDGINS